MGTAALENRLLQYNAKGHFMNALLCFMAMGDEVGRCGWACFEKPGGSYHPNHLSPRNPLRILPTQVAVKQKLDQFKAADYTFADARECKFVEKLCEVRARLCMCSDGIFVYVCVYVIYDHLHSIHQPTSPPFLPTACTQAWEAGDADAYTDHCAEYNAISALDPWKTSLLVKTKRAIGGGLGGQEEVDLT